MIFRLSVMFLSFQIGLKIVIAAVVCVILEKSSCLDPSPEATDPSYLKLLTTSRFATQTLMHVFMPSAFLVIRFVFLALISMS